MNLRDRRADDPTQPESLASVAAGVAHQAAAAEGAGAQAGEQVAPPDSSPTAGRPCSFPPVPRK